jgi:hypothetical protein
MIEKSELSERNISGITPADLLIKYKLWKDFEDVLKGKKINIESSVIYSDDTDVNSFASIQEDSLYFRYFIFYSVVFLFF